MADLLIRPFAPDPGRGIGPEAGGAEVFARDATRLLETDALRAWQAALDEHQLLVFRELALDDETQVALLETLGPALVENDSGRRHQHVSNVHEDGILGDERFAYHSDHAFMDDPIDVIALAAVELPDAGTTTRFVNAVRAAHALDDATRRAIGDRRGRHAIDPAAASGDVALDGPVRDDALPHAWHPILWPHPRTGEPILYVSEQQTDRVEGASPTEGRALLRSLFAHLYAERFTYVHRWRPGDLLVWDNRACQHARDAIPPGARRTLRRVSIGGTPVHEFFRRDPRWGLDARPEPRA